MALGGEEQLTLQWLGFEGSPGGQPLVYSQWGLMDNGPSPVGLDLCLM